MQKITVIGAGTMGNGIAHMCALHGNKVMLIDTKQSYLDKAILTIEKNLNRQVQKGLISEENKIETLKNIQTDILLANGAIDADLVIEAVSESFEVKERIYLELDELCPPKTILASNTSSISITSIAAITKRPDKVIGMHFMNPVPVMKLIEVIRGYNTSAETTKYVVELAQKMQKTPVEVNDYAGFIANRVLMPMINEAIIALHEGVAGVREIDTVMKLGMAHPMGPLQLADFIGLDICLSIMRVMQEGLGKMHYAPCPLLEKMVTAGKLGVKSGEGFYNYADPENILVSQKLRK
jgi:3-hydroxybutyryl-CoA dehydrogenase